VRWVVRIALYLLAVLAPPVALFATRQWLNGAISLSFFALALIFGAASLGTGAPVSLAVLTFTVLHAVICVFLYFDKE
jgi:hypothetical protein